MPEIASPNPNTNRDGTPMEIYFVLMTDWNFILCWATDGTSSFYGSAQTE